jgi:adenine-specific DNA-methyltransferase
MDNFEKISYDITKKLDKKTKKKEGIFFTPIPIIKKIFEHIDFKTIKHILEPSCGSCEFIYQLDNKQDLVIECVEYNKTIYDEITKLKFKNNVSIINEDFLRYNSDKKYDLIIGNPPYFVIKKTMIDNKYIKYFTGRPNIYIVFIIRCLELLTENGILAFVLPNNFLNCIYYDKLRKHINENYTILNIIENNDSYYIDTDQETFSLILQNKKSNNSRYVIELNNYTIFNNDVSMLKNLLQESTTLDKLSCNVYVGDVVWNQVKDLLIDDNKYTRLVYSGDIKDNKLNCVKYKNIEKKNFIKTTGKNNQIIVVNRGYGKGKYKFNYCYIDIKEPYCIENHLICIESEDNKTYDKILKSFEDKRTIDFINYYFKNNAINTTELKYILPIF